MTMILSIALGGQSAAAVILGLVVFGALTPARGALWLLPAIVVGVLLGSALGIKVRVC
jgi:hypothetical protein